jgi:hypothetical protein
MADGVLLDTSFLISFADPGRKHHAVAVQYFKFFAAEGLPMFLSTIAAAEFHQKQPVTDLPLDAIQTLPFNLVDAMRAAELDFTLFKGTPGVPRDALKDDFKLLGQVKANDIYSATDFLGHGTVTNPKANEPDVPANHTNPGRSSDQQAGVPGGGASRCARRSLRELRLGNAAAALARQTKGGGRVAASARRAARQDQPRDGVADSAPGRVASAGSGRNGAGAAGA